MREAARNKSFLRRLREEEKAKAPEIIPEPRPKKKRTYTKKPQIGGYRETMITIKCPCCKGSGIDRKGTRYSGKCLICNGKGVLIAPKKIPIYTNPVPARRVKGDTNEQTRN